MFALHCATPTACTLCSNNHCKSEFQEVEIDCDVFASKLRLLPGNVLVMRKNRRFGNERVLQLCHEPCILCFLTLLQCMIIYLGAHTHSPHMKTFVIKLGFSGLCLCVFILCCIRACVLRS